MSVFVLNDSDDIVKQRQYNLVDSINQQV